MRTMHQRKCRCGLFIAYANKSGKCRKCAQPKTDTGAYLPDAETIERLKLVIKHEHITGMGGEVPIVLTLD